ncbi:MAG: DUF2817 domain-containing protein [Spirochaetales bacterium]|nr:DUF2817 domain-containing protein [Spirochaetales bacterium]
MKQVVFFICLILLFASCTCVGNKPVEGWCGYDAYEKKRDYRRIVDCMGSLDSGHIAVTTIGKTTYGEDAYPLFDVFYDRSADETKDALVTGGVHGNEPAGFEAVIGYLRYLDRENPLLHYRVHFIPVVNPWGFIHNYRYNGNGYDINRDFNSFMTEEAALIKDYFKGKKLHLILDLHETGSKGGFIYNYSVSNRKTAENLMAYLSGKNLAIDNGYKDHDFETRDGILAFPAYLVHVQSWFSRSPLAHYFFIHYNKCSFTFESSVYESMKERIQVHTSVMEFFLEK